MTRYVALIDGSAGAYGVVIPDLSGCTAMGASIEEAMLNAVDAMREWAEIVEETGGTVARARPIEAVRADPDVADALVNGAILTTIAMIRYTGRPVKANLSLDAGTLATLDAEAKRHGLTRSAMVETLTKRLAAGGI